MDSPPPCMGTTLVTHFSLDRIDAFQFQCSVWPGPVSAAVDARDQDLAPGGRDALARAKQLVSRRPLSTLSLRSRAGREDWYPINSLRNIALKHARTHLVLLLDADFAPDAQLWPFLCSAAPAAAIHCIAERAVLVLPAFEAQQVTGADALSEGEVRRCRDVVAGAVRGDASALAAACGAGGPIQVFAEHIYPRGHAATQTDRWRELALRQCGVHSRPGATGSASAVWRLPYRVRYEEGYEPFLLACRWHLPAFDERLTGYGKNKVAHAARLAACGFAFDVLPGHFVLHRAHRASSDYERTFGAAGAGQQRADRVCDLYRDSLLDALLPDVSGLPPGHSGCTPYPHGKMRSTGGAVVETAARGSEGGASGGAQPRILHYDPPDTKRWNRRWRRRRRHRGSGGLAAEALPMGHWAPHAPDLEWLVAGVRSSGCVCGLSAATAAQLLRAAVDVHCCAGQVWARPRPTRPVPGAPASPCIVLATICSVDRLHRIPDLCAMWGGPLCAAVLRPQQAVAAAAAELRVRALRKRLARTTWRCRPLRIELCAQKATAEARGFPINGLRNAALAMAAEMGPAVLSIDADLLPSAGLHQALLESGAVQACAGAIRGGGVAVVVPALEPSDPTRTDPLDAAQLTPREAAGWIQRSDLRGFHTTHYAAGHRPTDLERWCLAAQSDAAPHAIAYEVPFQPGFEPYAVLATRSALPADDRFRGWGKDKVSWHRWLAAHGTRYGVTTAGFLIDRPHRRSVDWERGHGPRGDPALRAVLDGLGQRSAREAAHCAALIGRDADLPAFPRPSASGKQHSSWLQWLQAVRGRVEAGPAGNVSTLASALSVARGALGVDPPMDPAAVLRATTLGRAASVLFDGPADRCARWCAVGEPGVPADSRWLLPLLAHLVERAGWLGGRAEEGDEKAKTPANECVLSIWRASGDGGPWVPNDVQISGDYGMENATAEPGGGIRVAFRADAFSPTRMMAHFEEGTIQGFQCFAALSRPGFHCERPRGAGCCPCSRWLLQVHARFDEGFVFGRGGKLCGIDASTMRAVWRWTPKGALRVRCEWRAERTAAAPMADSLGLSDWQDELPFPELPPYAVDRPVTVVPTAEASLLLEVIEERLPGAVPWRGWTLVAVRAWVDEALALETARLLVLHQDALGGTRALLGCAYAGATAGEASKACGSVIRLRHCSMIRAGPAVAHGRGGNACSHPTHDGESEQ